jgi:hypothetical protein
MGMALFSLAIKCLMRSCQVDMIGSLTIKMGKFVANIVIWYHEVRSNFAVSLRSNGTGTNKRKPLKKCFEKANSMVKVMVILWETY